MPATFKAFGIVVPIIGVDKLTKELGGAQKKLNQFGMNATKVGRTMTIGLTAPILLFGASVIKTAGDFQSSMNRVSALTGETGEGFEKLRTQARELGATTQFSASQAADAMGFLGMAGFNTTQIIGAMPGTLQLAAAGQMELGRTADIASNILTGFGIETEKLGDVNNILVATFTKANTTLEELGEGMKFVAPVAKGMGIDITEVAAAMGVLADAGIKGAMGGTALRGSLAKLSKPSAEAVAVLSKLGIRRDDMLDAVGNVKSLTNTVRVLEDKGASAADLLTIFGQRAGPAMTAMVNQGVGALTGLQDEILGAGNIAERVAKKQMEGFNGTMKELKSAFQELQLAIADSGILDFVTDLGRKLTGFLRQLSQLNPAFFKWGAVIGIVVAAIGPLVLALGVLATTAAAVIALFSSAAIASFIAIAAPIAAIAGSVLLVALALGVVINFFRVLAANWDTLAKPWEDFGVFLKAIGIFVVDLLRDIGSLQTALLRLIMPKWLERFIGITPGIEGAETGANVGADAAAGAALGGSRTNTNNAAVAVTFENMPTGARAEIREGDNVSTETLSGPMPATAQ
jgi:TP901 family phage tail tape measure protein